MEATTHNDHQEFIFRSKLPDIDIPNHLPLHSYCFQNISDFMDRPCLINSATGHVHTYADVDLTSRKVAAGLAKMGVRQGDVIMLLLQNSPEFVLAFLGASLIGAATTAANPFFTAAEVARQAKASNAKLIITQSSCVDKVKDVAAENGVKVVCTDSAPEGCFHFSELAGADEREAPAVKISSDEVVALPYSSGTTGLPKGVMVTHKGLVTSLAQQMDGENPNLYYHKNDVVLCLPPMFHILSTYTVLCALRVGAAILIMQKFEITKLFEVVEEYKVTIAPLVPPILLAIAKSPDVDKYDLSSMRWIMSAAAPLGKELEDAIRTILPNVRIGQGYGMTEAGPVIAMSPALAKEPLETKLGAVGIVARNAELKIVDPETGFSLPHNHPGEICIRGSQLMKGYLNNPEATERTIDNQGWLHSGDIGFIDNDGEIFVTGRIKELIKYKGFQVAPAELESILMAHPNISDAAVVPMKDEVAGEIPVAFIVRSSGSEITDDEIKQYILDQVVFYKRIRRIFFTDAIPKTPAGKILRKDLRARLAAEDVF